MRAFAARFAAVALWLLVAHASAPAQLDERGRWANGVTEAWWFESHRNDGDKPTALVPTVPPEYRQHVRRPVDARVTRVGKAYVEVDPEDDSWDELVTPVRINAGSDRGLKRGMTLHALDSDDQDERVELTRVGANYALGIIVRSVRKRPIVKMYEGDDGKDEPREPIAVGWRLTTSLYKWTLRNEARHAAREAEQGTR